VSNKRVSTGTAGLDAMLGNKGFFRGSSILISGTAGTGKTSMAAAFAESYCERGEKCIYFSFEESPSQLIRNLGSIGIDLARCQKSGKLLFHSVRPTIYGLEMHLASIHKLVKDFKPDAVVIDPVTNMLGVGDTAEIKAMMTRVIDFLKNEGITCVFTSLTEAESALEASMIGISSLMDTWVLIRMIETSGERNRQIYMLKSRGMAHSNQKRDFRISSRGIEISDGSSAS
jgi:circadian clock protein KaiC